jgi:hypothetical protein
MTTTLLMQAPAAWPRPYVNVGSNYTLDVNRQINAVSSDVPALLSLGFFTVGPSAPSLESLSDVTVTSPADNDVLTYNSASKLWKNQVGGGGGLTGFTASLNTTAPNDAVNASELLASGGTTDQDAVFSPAGLGAFLLQLPDGTTVGGNKRGINSVDLQQVRSDATMVAGGDYSAVLSGANNKVDTIGAHNYIVIAGGNSGLIRDSSYSFLGSGQNNQIIGSEWSAIGSGNGNEITGSDYGFIGAGEHNVLSGTNAVIVGGNSNASYGNRSFMGAGLSNITAPGSVDAVLVGGNNNVADAAISYIPGGSGAWTRGIVGYGVVASGSFSVSGDAQLGKLSTRTQTTDATPTALTSDDNSPSAQNQLTLVDNETVGFHGSILGREGAPAGPITASEISQAGTGYAIGDTGTVTTGNGDATYIVNTVGMVGNVQTYTLTAAGTGYSNGANIPTATGGGQPGAGVGFTLDIATAGGGQSSYWEFKGVVKRGIGAASTALIGTITPTLIAQDAGASTWAVAVTADTTNGALAITVTGAPDANINWVGRVETEELVV